MKEKKDKKINNNPARDNKIAELEILRQSLEEKEKEAKENYERFVRLGAEFENFKKRLDKEKRALIDFAHKDIIINLLPVIDSFEKALNPNNEKNEDFHKGIKLIFSQLLEVLTKQGLKKMDLKDKIFDPNFHEVVAVEKNDELEENTIVDELHPGYMLHDKVLRAAMVKISKK